MPDYNLSYVYVFAFFVVGAGLVSVMMLLSHLLAPFKPTREKLRMSPERSRWGRPGAATPPALLHLRPALRGVRRRSDLPLPWAVLFRELGWFGLGEMVVFIGILVVGLFYAWKKKALNWY